MESENRHEFDVTLGTFDHPRYEKTRAAFPDQRNELRTLKGRLATVLNHPVTIAGAFLRRARKS